MYQAQGNANVIIIIYIFSNFRNSTYSVVILEISLCKYSIEEIEVGFDGAVSTNWPACKLYEGEVQRLSRWDG